MKKSKILKLTLIVFTVSCVIAYLPFHKWARKHTNWATAVEDHPTGCISCHLYRIKDGPVARLINEEYISPFNLSVSKDGRKLFVVAQEEGSLIITDLTTLKETAKIKVGKMPHTVILSNDEKRAYITNQWSDNISVIDLVTLTVKETLSTGNGPAGLTISSDDRYLTVVNSYSNDISVIDLQKGEEIRRLEAGNNPTGVQVSPDGNTTYVTSRRALITPYGSPVETEITMISNTYKRVEKRININSAYMIENIAFTPSGDLALFTMIRPKNLVPSIQVERGWMMTNGFGIIENKPEGRIIQLLFDEPNAYYADPYDIVITPDGKKAFISNAGVNRITVIDIDSVRNLISVATDKELATFSNHLGISSRYVTGRVQTGANPKGLAISPDGRTLYVAEQLEDKVAIINTENLEVTGSIDLGGPRRITVARQGRRLLNNAGGTFQNQYSCYTCHPDTHEDGLVYNMASKDMGRNLANTQTLRSIGDIPPYKWNGKNQTIYKQDGMRFSTVLTRNEPFSPGELDALVAYISTGIKNPPNLVYNPDGNLTAAQLAGKKIFERTHDFYGNEIPVTNRCITCHPYPHYTNKKMVDVGTLAVSDDSTLFDTPHLNNIYSSPPYLHDGRAHTLEEIWTIYGKEELHGSVNDLTKIDLNNLIEYLKTFRDAEYDKDKNKTLTASFKRH
jgi:YVTN family beta-propeller protein